MDLSVIAALVIAGIPMLAIALTIPYVVWHGIRDTVRQMHFETEMEQERRRLELRKRIEINPTNLRVIPGGKDN